MEEKTWTLRQKETKELYRRLWTVIGMYSEEVGGIKQSELAMAFLLCIVEFFVQTSQETTGRQIGRRH